MWFENVFSAFRTGLHHVGKLVDRAMPTILRSAKWVARGLEGAPDPRISGVAKVVGYGLDFVQNLYDHYKGKGGENYQPDRFSEVQQGQMEGLPEQEGLD